MSRDAPPQFVRSFSLWPHSITIFIIIALLKRHNKWSHIHDIKAEMNQIGKFRIYRKKSKLLDVLTTIIVRVKY